MVKLLFMDIDGTMTDGKIYFGDSGEIFKAFNIKDGYGIAHILPRYEIVPIVITGRQSDIVENRCIEIGIEFCYQNVVDKQNKMIEISKEFGLSVCATGIIPHTAYIGDDLPDLPCIRLAEESAAPCDAVEQVKNEVSYVCNCRAGEGAVREFIEWLVCIEQ